MEGEGKMDQKGRNSRKRRNGKREGITLITCTPIPLTLFTLHPLTPSLPTTLTPFIMRNSTTLLWPRAEARWRGFLCLGGGGVKVCGCEGGGWWRCHSVWV